MAQTIEVLRRQQNLGLSAHLCNQILAHEGWRHAEFIFAAILVRAHVFQLDCVGNAIPGEIVAPLADAQFVVNARNGIAQGLKLVAQKEREMGKHGFAG
jgi:hypothetical protein